MNTTRSFFRGLVQPPKRAKYVRRLLQDGIEVDSQTLLVLARRFGISSVTRPYLERYSVLLDVNGRSLTETVLAEGSFQNDVLMAFVRHLPDRSLAFVNVGANVGTTCLNAHNAGFRTIVAFEPVAANFSLLEANLRQIEADSDLRLERLALGASLGRREIFLNPASTGRHSLVKDFGQGSTEIEVAKLDDVAPARPSALWIDAEGYEAEILRGAPTFLEQHCAAMCLEITPSLLGEAGLASIDAIGRRYFRTVATPEGLTAQSLLDLAPVRAGHVRAKSQDIRGRLA